MRDKDQFYTKRNIAEYCFQIFNRIADDIGVDLSKKH